VSGYLSPQYAESFAEFGLPVLLPHSRGHVLRRRIPATSYSDAAGRYSLFCCEDWRKIGQDLDTLDPELVSLCPVAFTKGWATDVRPGYLCGRVLRTDLYASLVQARGVVSALHFPGYRAPSGAQAGCQPFKVP
jgi:hypothetical protein